MIKDRRLLGLMYSFTEDLAGTFLWTHELNFNLFNCRHVP